MKFFSHNIPQIFALKYLLHPIERQKKPVFVETIIGYEQFGLITICWFWNLYQNSNGTRSCTKFHGGEVEPTQNTDYSAPTQIDRWLHGGPLPRSIFIPYEPKTTKAQKRPKYTALNS